MLKKSIPQKLKITTNPYIGLRPFKENDNHLFFGRDKQIKDIIINLKNTGFTAIIGSSGSGKSSLIRSGLIPALKKGIRKGQGEGWKIGIFKPGYDPIGSLAKSLISLGITNYNSKDTKINNSKEHTSSILRSHENGISNVLNDFTKENSENILIIIDQFEEIFRGHINEKGYPAGSRDFSLFVNLILNTLSNKRVYIVLSMRSDFLADCTRFFGLPEALNKGQYLIPRMTKYEVNEVITKPLRLINATISETLVESILNQIENRQTQLPILQHTLMRIVDFWKNKSNSQGSIDIEHYNAVGGLEKALSNHADEAYLELKTEEDKNIIESIFKSITDTSSNSDGIRRPCSLVKLSQQINVSEAKIKEVIQGFRSSERSFIFPSLTQEINGEDMIDISHESLMREWERLKNWLTEELDSSKIYLNLCSLATLYQEGRGSLLINPELAIVLKWREKQRPTETWGSRYDTSFPRAINFLEESKTKFDLDVLKKSLVQSQKTKRNKRLLIFFSVLSILLLGLTFFANQETERATKNEKIAIEAKEDADISALAAKESAENAAKAAEKAKKNEEIAIEAKEDADKSALAAKESEENAAEAAVKAKKNEEIAIEAKEYADKSALAAKKSEESAQTAKIKAQNAEEKATRLKNVSDAIKMAFEAEKNLDLNKIDNAIVQSKKAHNLFIKNGNLERENQIYSALSRSLFEGKSKKVNFYNNINSIGFSTISQSNSSKEFMTLDNSKKVSFYTSDDTGKINTLNKEFKNIDLALYSTNGDYILLTKNLSKGEGKLLIYNEKNKQLIESFPFSSHIKSLNSFQYLNQQYISFKVNNNSFLLNLNIVKYYQYENSDENDLFSFSGKGGYFISKKNNIALLYQVTFNQSSPKLTLIKTIEALSNITSYQFSKDDNMLAIGTQKGTVLIYNTNNSSKVKISKHQNVKISDLDFVKINNQNFVITASYDNTINLVNIENNNDFLTLKGHKSWVKNITVDQENKILYSVSEDASFRYWYLDQNALENQLKNQKNDIK